MSSSANPFYDCLVGLVYFALSYCMACLDGDKFFVMSIDVISYILNESLTLDRMVHISGIVGWVREYHFGFRTD